MRRECIESTATALDPIYDNNDGDDSGDGGK